ncbi:MAG: elongation factor P maturation arginine rhamnosyltransferase EarP [Betaproteobacteria bacterium]|nr:elongation factor P maturation arginine rhamnosyltransferase EarP [Betaproteobacteria bacterium]
MRGTKVPGTWDIFCRVVDNFGDIGVCWRLARQLAGEQRGTVRLWVDDLAPLHALWREADPGRARQLVAGVEVHRWSAGFPAVQPAEVVIEAFGCGLPEDYVLAMVGCGRHPLWVVLEYLSAERWVPEHHGLPSPHPRWPIPRYFFFPGFVAGTGGVLCEADLAARRAAFGADERRRAWASLGFEPPVAGSTVVSMFAYDHAPLAGLLAAWEQGDEPVVVAVPQGKIVGSFFDYFDVGGVEPGHGFRRGSIEVRILPFVEQPRYDELLWSCDCNFVRGEDSFVRAQWAALPLVWHIYPQAERAHWHKLEAFLDLYCAGLPQPAAAAVRAMWRSWNSSDDPAVSIGAAWRGFQAHRATLAGHAQAWAARLAELGDMAGRLAQFCAERVKY